LCRLPMSLGRIASSVCWRHSSHPPLVDPASAAAQTVLAASNHVGGRNSLAHAIRLGHVLWIKVNLGAVAIHKVFTRPPRLPFNFEDIHAYVCSHRDCYRQRTSF